MTQGSPPWYITHTEALLHDCMKLLLVNLLVSRLVQKTCDATYYVILYQHLGVADIQQFDKALAARNSACAQAQTRHTAR